MNKKIFLGLTIILIGLFLITLSVIRQSAKITVTPVTEPLIANMAIQLPVEETDPLYGNPGSAVTIDEFFSFNCEECATLHKKLISFVDSHQSKVRLRSTEILQTNWLGQQQDTLPIMALTCAANQGKYWLFLDKELNADKLNETSLKTMVKDLKLNETEFNGCLKDETVKTKIQNKQTVLQSANFTETPLVFINNRKVNLTDDINISNILESVVKE